MELLVTVLAVVALVSMWWALRERSARSNANTLAQQMMDTWREREVGRIREEANAVARQLLKSWRESELTAVAQELNQRALDRAKVELSAWMQAREQSIRADAVKRSGAVNGGKMTEHLAALFPQFIFNPRDARFLGSPVDLIVFDGLSEGHVKRIVFLEVKTGRSRITEREKSVRECVGRSEVAYEVLLVAAAPVVGAPPSSDAAGGSLRTAGSDW